MKNRVSAISLAMMLAFASYALAASKGLDNLLFSKKLNLAQAGNSEAKFVVAQAYEVGQGVTRDEAEAAKWYRKAALGGNMDAQFRLAKLVSLGAPPRLKADKLTAYKLFLAAAQNGHALSQNEVGLILQNGIGVAKDNKSAVGWYRKAADQGLATAQNNLGVMLLNAQGADRNVDEAFKYFTQAAAKNDIWGLNNLGAMYQKGWGTPIDFEKARLNFKKAADLGNATAMTNLAKLDSSHAKAAPASAP